MGSVILDSSVVIACVNRGDPHHNAVVGRLVELEADGAGFAISAVGLTELMSNPNAGERARMREFIGRLGDSGVIAVDREIAELAGEFRVQRRSLRTPDALIAATAAVEGSGQLLTTDRRLARIDGVEYVGAKRR